MKNGISATAAHGVEWNDVVIHANAGIQFPAPDRRAASQMMRRYAPKCTRWIPISTGMTMAMELAKAGAKAMAKANRIPVCQGNDEEMELLTTKSKTPQGFL
ncbi:MAG: hypothetical protein LBI87_06530 [Candidatus Accumulibacter sp.]|jgi:hypothetical protein|nr:hypothetical protein [Accumulibacter sp.]